VKKEDTRPRESKENEEGRKQLGAVAPKGNAAVCLEEGVKGKTSETEGG